jgi:MFS family permease
MAPRVRLFNRNVRLYFATWACIGFGFGGFHTVLLNLYLLRLGYGPEFIGTANGTITLLLALSSFPAGWLARRYGYRRMLTVGMGLCIAYAVVPVSGLVSSVARAPTILIGLAVFGIGAATVMVSGPPFLMANVRPEHRNRTFSMRSAISPLFAFAGSLAAGLLPGLLAAIRRFAPDGPGAYGVSLAVTPVLLAVGFFFLLLTRAIEEPSTAKVASERTGRPPVRLMVTLAAVNLLVMGSIRSTRMFFNVYMDTELLTPTFLIGGAVAAGQLLSVPSALLMPGLARKIGRSQTLVLAVCLLLLSQLLLAVVPQWLFAGAGLAGIIVSFAVFECAFAVHSQELVAAEWRSVMVGATTAARGVSTFAVVFGGGYLVAAFGHRPLFIINAALALLACVVFLFSDNLWPARDKRHLGYRSA